VLNVRITGYDAEVDRGEDEGLHITYDMESESAVTSFTFWLDDGATPLELTFPVKQGSDGRYFRGFNVKPTITGEFHFHIQLGNAAGEFGEAVSPTKVKVTGGEVEDGDPMEDLSNLWDLVRQTRIDVHPDLYQLGHPEATRDGFLRLDRVGENQHDKRTGHERGAEWLKELMRRAKDIHPSYNIGLATAKPGSENHGGATDKYPMGFVQDIYVLGDNGAHWDFQIDGGEGGYPDCRLVDEFNEEGNSNWLPIKARFVPIEDL
jgi:hypothetical protein